jgi:hypothetical protein
MSERTTGLMMWALLTALLVPIVLLSSSPVQARTAPWTITKTEWSPADEQAYSDFIEGLGAEDCWTMDECLKSPSNPYRASDPKRMRWRSDCADLPYLLRAYFAWKNGLPFSHQNGVVPASGRSRDFRYTRNGNRVVSRDDVPATSAGVSAIPILFGLRSSVSTAMFRHSASADDPINFTDMYSPALNRDAIRPGTIAYDVNGHVAMVWRVDKTGRVLTISAHPDNSISRSFYGRNFLRTKPALGTGFKNWRPIKLVNATQNAQGVYVGGHIQAKRNSEIADYSLAQYLGTDPQPGTTWRTATYSHNGEALDYYHYLRAAMAIGDLTLRPVPELRSMVRNICTDIRNRKDAVDRAINNGLQNMSPPAKLPDNIYGTYGYWEMYSTPSRDARLKTDFKELRDHIQMLVESVQAGTSSVVYEGTDVAADLLQAYEEESQACRTSYTSNNGRRITLTVDDVIQRLFNMSFDPYQCVARRWGSSDPAELNACPDGPVKRRWYHAQANLRNQMDRTYDVFMGYSVAELENGPYSITSGKGLEKAPDVDLKAYLMSLPKGISSQKTSQSAAAPVSD